MIKTPFVAHDPAGEASVDWYHACGVAHHP